MTLVRGCFSYGFAFPPLLLNELSERDRTKALEAKHTQSHCIYMIRVIKMAATGCNNIAIAKAFQKQETARNYCQMKGSEDRRRTAQPPESCDVVQLNHDI
jgi:hypothetical protein